MHKETTHFTSFLTKTLSPHHTAAYVCDKLNEAGFTKLDERKTWHLTAGAKYFVQRGCTVTAFITPKQGFEKAHILASHLDTPALKLRPNPLFFKEDQAFFRTEIYGGPHLYSLANRKLQLAGAVWHNNPSELETPQLVQGDHQHFFIPTCPIHLDKTTNTQPQPIEKHNGLAILVGAKKPRANEEEQLTHFFQTHFQTRLPLAFDLYFTVCETPYTIDSEKTKLAAPRLDNSVSVFAQLEAVLGAGVKEDTLLMAPFFHHEEVGSRSDQGADSNYLNALIARITSHFDLSLDALEAFKSRSSILSLDNAHAFWPLDADKYDKPNTPILGKGPALKLTSSMRYATSPELMAKIKHLAAKHAIPLQMSVPHNGYPAGSTLGPLLAHSTNIPTLDLGIGQCSMHAASELIDLNDLAHLVHLVKSYF